MRIRIESRVRTSWKVFFERGCIGGPPDHLTFGDSLGRLRGLSIYLYSYVRFITEMW